MPRRPLRPLTRLFFLLLACCNAGPTPAPQRLPNIVVLYADDLGYGDLSCYNPQSKIPTPNLDRLASEGLRCLDAHSSSGICTPSRYSLLTGRHHWRDFHDIVNSFGPSVFAPGRATIADLLRQRGYRTACIGKWHLGWDWNAIKRQGATPQERGNVNLGYAPDAFDWSAPIPDGPCAHGFDHYFGDDVPNFPPYTWIENDRVLRPPTVPFAPDPKPAEGSAEGRPGPMAAGWRLDEVMPTLTAHAVRWLQQQRGAEQPFFLYMPFTSPHAPIVPSAEFVGSTAAGPYGDYVHQTDATVGAVLAALEANGLAADTLVVFSSDNGPEAYAWERVRRFDHRSMGELRGLKRDVWEGGHRVPFLVRWPGNVAPGAVSDALLGQVDLFATIAAVVGAAVPDGAAEDSFDQLPLWRGESDHVREFLVHNTYKTKYGLRQGDWLYLDAPDGGHREPPAWFRAQEGYGPSDQPVALYDLRADPGQRHNLAAEHPEVCTELAALLTKLRQQGHSAPRLER
ncbi:MAG: sulfatase-like hydrolase/transferase [Planctomycetes bacterium]|nr:sulfatase-like hydrolase/transferase [Planctomycetota bacterium]